jgi:hypothetical protein
VPGHGQAAAVAARSGQHDDGPRREQQLPEISQIPPGILQHPRETDAEVPGHGPVDLPHLPGAHRRNGSPDASVNMLASHQETGAVHASAIGARSAATRRGPRPALAQGPLPLYPAIPRRASDVPGLSA